MLVFLQNQPWHANLTLLHGLDAGRTSELQRRKPFATPTAHLSTCFASPKSQAAGVFIQPSCTHSYLTGLVRAISLEQSYLIAPSLGCSQSVGEGTIVVLVGVVREPGVAVVVGGSLGAI